MQRQNLKSLVHPLLLEFVRDSTSLVDDVVSIIGLYWLTLYDLRPGSISSSMKLFYYDAQDSYECLDGPTLTPDHLTNHITNNVFKFIFQQEVEGRYTRGVCVLGRNDVNVYLLRIMYLDSATSKSSMSVDRLLQYIPIHLYQQLVKDQHLRQENEFTTYHAFNISL